MISKIKRTFGFILDHKLASKQKFRSFKELITWQAQTFLNPQKSFIKRFAGDLQVEVKKGQTGMTGNIYTGLHEFEDMAFLLHLLRTEDVFIDAGANVGSYTLLAAGKVGSKTYTFEPVPSTFKILSTNVSLNNLTEVYLFNKGLSSDDGVLHFSALDDTTNHVVLNPGEENVLSVPVTTLDKIVGNNFPTLIKIDVEGFETPVLAGATNILENQTLKAIIIELNGSGLRYGFKDSDIHQKLLALGFAPCDYDPFTRNIKLKNTYGTANTIYIRDLAFVEDRVKTAISYEVLGTQF
ncbi:MAG: FkbM family methyltransferase [Sphingobacteriaceae bacterium]|jgi:FkbM family methyltransferase|nr:FkbM family methyltransferase [Sphingobacteriaceae bacterium]